MFSLQVPGSDAPIYEKRSDKMAELAKTYHENLQSEGLASPEEQEEAEKADLNDVKKLSQQNKAKLSQYLMRGGIARVLKRLPNGKAPGIDGPVHELWKSINEKFERTKKNQENKSLNIANFLKMVYNDIEKYGVHPETHFAEGWMCLIHKKNDERNVANYRPITLLNTDYEILTKVLAIRLAETAPSVIHRDQAGFIPGLYQVKLVESIISHVEHEGTVVALDQEKAYDKISHKYLWNKLEKANFPQHFIGTMKSLYEHAYTSVTVSGEQSSRYRVTRGVRQGDPISCLLFNLAIEPLAQMIRASDLQGFPCPDREDRIIAALFADDTTVCLSEEDNFAGLDNILEVWCKASGAKFNKGKTQVIPIGPETYRNRVGSGWVGSDPT
jgi:hypothetical protein